MNAVKTKSRTNPRLAIFSRLCGITGFFQQESEEPSLSAAALQSMVFGPGNGSPIAMKVVVVLYLGFLLS